MYAGDRIQVRRNNPNLQLANWEEYVIRTINTDRSIQAQLLGEYGTTVNQTIKTIPADYVVASTHLSYPSTINGLQSTTEHHGRAGVDVALYVPMTRGKQNTTAIIVTKNRTEAIEQLTNQILQSNQEITQTQPLENLRIELSKVGDNVTSVEPNSIQAAQHSALNPTEQTAAEKHQHNIEAKWNKTNTPEKPGPNLQSGPAVLKAPIPPRTRIIRQAPTQLHDKTTHNTKRSQRWPISATHLLP